MQSHDLDVLVELAGQSSTNRANLLKMRLARLQLSGIGYPPTTGLSSVDGKWLDPYTWTKNAAAFYAERPFVLPESFWCFNPLEQTPEPLPPPSSFNGYITFGCTGNTAKITDEALQHWREILSQVKGSRLRLQSINFEDDAARELMESRLHNAGFDLDDVDLLRPVGGDAFLRSYNEVDIILDTFPFNGGTTTAFALYMGVPVVSVFGESLTSRMGLSMLSNMKAAQLATNNWVDYVRIAVATANNGDFLRSFRQSARSQFTETGLGNGKKFTRDFEAACITALNEANSRPPYKHHVRPLPADELARRAYLTLSTGQFDAAQRIALYCLQHYPTCGAAHIIRSQAHLRNKDFAGATSYLENCLSNLSAGDTPAVLINLLRLDIYREDIKKAQERWQALSSLPLIDPLDIAHVNLYKAQLGSWARAEIGTSLTPASSGQAIRCTIAIVADDEAHFAAMQQHIRSITANSNIQYLAFINSDERNKLSAYRQALDDSRSDFTVLLQSNVIPQHPNFLDRIANALTTSDLVASSGCRVWRQLDWRTEAFDQKVGTTLCSSSEADAFIEITQWSNPENALTSDLAVLDGKLLAARTGSLKFAEFDGRLMGYDTLMEEAWSHECFRSGARLSVHQGLGVHVGSADPLTEYNRSDACWTVAEAYGFPAFNAVRVDRSVVGTPCRDLTRALQTLDALQSQNQP
jgi:hypothetical protein